MDITTMRECTRCHIPYVWKGSTSSLKLTYCSIFCEQADLGFTIEGLEKLHFEPRRPVISDADLSAVDALDAPPADAESVTSVPAGQPASPDEYWGFGFPV